MRAHAQGHGVAPVAVPVAAESVARAERVLVLRATQLESFLRLAEDRPRRLQRCLGTADAQVEQVPGVPFCCDGVSCESVGAVLGLETYPAGSASGGSVPVASNLRYD
jgi:hypothetical protein